MKEIKHYEETSDQSEIIQRNYEENLRGLLEDEHVYQHVKTNVNEKYPRWKYGSNK